MPREKFSYCIEQEAYVHELAILPAVASVKKAVEVHTTDNFFVREASGGWADLLRFLIFE